MPIVTSIILSQNQQIDGRTAVTERHTDHNGQDYDIDYLAAIGVDIYAIMAARAIALGADIDAQEAQELESHNYEIPLSQIAFLKRFTATERTAVYVAKRTDAEVEDVWNFVLLAINGVYLNDPVTIAGLALLETKELIGVGRAVEIGTA
jgi:hypothetical protein